MPWWRCLSATEIAKWIRISMSQGGDMPSIVLFHNWWGLCEYKSFHFTSVFLKRIYCRGIYWQFCVCPSFGHFSLFGVPIHRQQQFLHFRTSASRTTDCKWHRVASKTCCISVLRAAAFQSFIGLVFRTCIIWCSECPRYPKLPSVWPPLQWECCIRPYATKQAGSSWKKLKSCFRISADATAEAKRIKRQLLSKVDTPIEDAAQGKRAMPDGVALYVKIEYADDKFIGKDRSRSWILHENASKPQACAMESRTLQTRWDTDSLHGFAATPPPSDRHRW